MEETKGGKGDGKRLTKTWVWDCMAPYWVFDTVVKAELVILSFLSSTLRFNVVSLIPFKCFWAMGSEVATLSTDAKSSSFDVDVDEIVFFLIYFRPICWSDYKSLQQ